MHCVITDYVWIIFSVVLLCLHLLPRSARVALEIHVHRQHSRPLCRDLHPGRAATLKANTPRNDGRFSLIPTEARGSPVIYVRNPPALCVPEVEHHSKSAAKFYNRAQICVNSHRLRRAFKLGPPSAKTQSLRFDDVLVGPHQLIVFPSHFPSTCFFGWCPSSKPGTEGNFCQNTVSSSVYSQSELLGRGRGRLKRAVGGGEPDVDGGGTQRATPELLCQVEDAHLSPISPPALRVWFVVEQHPDQLSGRGTFQLNGASGQAFPSLGRRNSGTTPAQQPGARHRKCTRSHSAQSATTGRSAMLRHLPRLLARIPAANPICDVATFDIVHRRAHPAATTSATRVNMGLALVPRKYNPKSRVSLQRTSKPQDTSRHNTPFICAQCSSTGPMPPCTAHTYYDGQTRTRRVCAVGGLVIAAEWLLTLEGYTTVPVHRVRQLHSGHYTVPLRDPAPRGRQRQHPPARDLLRRRSDHRASRWPLPFLQARRHLMPGLFTVFVVSCIGYGWCIDRRTHIAGPPVRSSPVLPPRNTTNFFLSIEVCSGLASTCLCLVISANRAPPVFIPCPQETCRGLV
ncbi:hypothetical protein DFH09DRAFT_1076754 [Mycena vulgaris]|nr:hypothetical protein DFH09DRAFT_1076754 [Mycena vulgaris]